MDVVSAARQILQEAGLPLHHSDISAMVAHKYPNLPMDIEPFLLENCGHGSQAMFSTVQGQPGYYKLLKKPTAQRRSKGLSSPKVKKKTRIKDADDSKSETAAVDPGKDMETKLVKTQKTGKNIPMVKSDGHADVRNENVEVKDRKGDGKAKGKGEGHLKTKIKTKVKVESVSTQQTGSHSKDGKHTAGLSSPSQTYARYQHKYRKLKRLAKDLIFINAAYCDEVINTEVEVTQTVQECKYLVTRLAHRRRMATLLSNAGISLGKQPTGLPKAQSIAHILSNIEKRAKKKPNTSPKSGAKTTKQLLEESSKSKLKKVKSATESKLPQELKPAPPMSSLEHNAAHLLLSDPSRLPALPLETSKVPMETGLLPVISVSASGDLVQDSSVTGSQPASLNNSGQSASLPLNDPERSAPILPVNLSSLPVFSFDPNSLSVLGMDKQGLPILPLGSSQAPVFAHGSSQAPIVPLGSSQAPAFAHSSTDVLPIDSSGTPTLPTVNSGGLQDYPLGNSGLPVLSVDANSAQNLPSIAGQLNISPGLNHSNLSSMTGLTQLNISSVMSTGMPSQGTHVSPGDKSNMAEHGALKDSHDVTQHGDLPPVCITHDVYPVLTGGASSYPLHIQGAVGYSGQGEGVASLTLQDVTSQVTLPLELGPLTVHCLGEIVYDRPAYHTEDCLYPVGYHTIHRYLSVSEENAVYHCKVLDGGPAPQFEISQEDSSIKYTGASPTECHQQLIQAINKARNLSLPVTDCGLEFFGLSHPTVRSLLQCLPDVQLCTKYRASSEDLTGESDQHVTVSYDLVTMETEKCEIAGTPDITMETTTSS